MSQSKFTNTLLDLARAHSNNADTLFVVKKREARKSDAWKEISGVQFWQDIQIRAKDLRNQGINAGDQVPLIAPSSYDTVVSEFAIYALEATAVCIYETSSKEQVDTFSQDIKEANQQKNAPSSVACAVFTAGRSGSQVRVNYTHAQLLENANVASKQIKKSGIDMSTYMSILSLAHIASKIFLYVALLESKTVVITPGARYIIDDLQYSHPTWMLSVPRVYDRIYTELLDSASRGFFKRIFKSKLNHAFESIPNPKFASKIRSMLGLNSETRKLVTFSTAVRPDPKLRQLFEHFGIAVYDTYSVTEAGGIIAMNTPDFNKAGTAGKILDGLNVRTENGEIIVNDVHTGDIGEIDDDGFVTISGREKEVLTISSGQSILPDPIQQALATDPLIFEALVIGERRPYLSALIVLDKTHKEKVLADCNLDEDTVEADVLIDRQIKRALDKVNHILSRDEKIKQYAILEDGFEDLANSVSASGNFKRDAVCKYYKDLINEVLYN